MVNNLREGFSTGSCAAAAAKAAVLMLLKQEYTDKVNITLPRGNTATFLIYGSKLLTSEACCYVIKDAGDDPDITNGVQVWAKARKTSLSGIKIKGGTGIGIVTKPGLPVEVGQPAINPIPRQMIINEILQVTQGLEEGIEVELSIPNGEILAQKTLNSHLGIVGGLSILGTTGIVKPMSEEAYKNSLVPQLKITYALGYKIVVLTPGNIGHQSAVNHGIPDDVICQTSNFLGFMLEECEKVGFKKILLWGHPGKLLKVACGNFHTHNRIADGRMETLAAYLATLAAPVDLVKKVLNCTTTEQAMELVEQCGFEKVWELICHKVSLRAEKFLFNKVQVGTVLLKDRRKILTLDQKAKKFGEELNWPLLPL
ncbi:MAG: cobalt-precorrin-5B (C1)-methyltransferase [Clostridia bacterium]|jgi:cobalt-precorrin-5B (C1)-methyltransferase|nr:cobalt-precorrin-5B (C1)-methyltransferase [Clostridia bacterium]MDN5323944.1 cobalt-precorrin-5B (C1)-methyltransferase [Clostridia bacterium]